MDTYMKNINTKMAKLTIVEDEEKRDDDDLRANIISAFEIDIENADQNASAKFRTPNIHALLTKESLQGLRMDFMVVLAEKNTGLNLDQFKSAVGRAINYKISTEKIEELFYKVDVMKNESVTWEAYSNYLLLEMDQMEKLHRMEKELLGENIQFLKTEGRDSIKSLFIVPSGDFDPSDTKGLSKDADSRYFTCSRDGVMNFWSHNFQTCDTHLLHGFAARGTTPGYWVTAVECLPDARLLAVATTDFNVYVFHHGNNKEFSLNSKIVKFPGTVVCLSYSREEAPGGGGGSYSFLTWGDEHGGVGVVAFHVNPGKTALGVNSKNNFNKKGRFQEFHFTDLSNNHVVGLEARYIGSLHHRYVCQVRYVPKIHNWITCAKDTCTALYIGDLVPYVPPNSRIYYSVLHGITVFEYCEKMNFIITGGCDMLIRLWNPMAKGNKMVGVLRGHVSPLTHLMLDAKDLYLVSVGESKDILIFDLVDQVCTQKIKQHRLKKLGKKPVTAACINKKSHTVVVASNMRLAVIEGKEDSNAKKVLTTSSAPITAALYNPLFRQIVTGDWKSQVIVWSLTTGAKVVHYTAHTVQERGKEIEVDIKVMSFDATHRRLVTGHRDGMVKIWNYNVGVLLQELPVPGGFEVTSICCPPGKIFVAGCSCSVLLHVEKKHRSGYTALRPLHPSNVTQMAMLQDTCLASASADGTIIVFSLKTHLPQFKFSLVDPEAPASVDFYRGLAALYNRQGEAGWNLSSSASSRGLLTSARIEKRLASLHRAALGKSTTSKPKPMSAPGDRLHYTYCVEALVFLSTRKLTPDTAALLTCMHNGKVLAWSVNLYGKCLGEFVAAHAPNEMLYAADASRDDTFLVTGDSLGYIKVWDISHYYNPEVGDCSHALDAQRFETWEKFPYVRMRRNIEFFLRKHPDANLPLHMRTKCAWPQPGQGHMPHIINSFKSHNGSIISLKIVQINEYQLIVSAGSDMSVRIWSIQGLFVGVLGQKSLWTNPEIVFGSLPNGPKEIEAMATVRKQDKQQCTDRVYSKFPPEWTEEVVGPQQQPSDESFEWFMSGYNRLVSKDFRAPRLNDMIGVIENWPESPKVEASAFGENYESLPVGTSVASGLTQTESTKFQLYNLLGEKMSFLLDQLKKKNIVKSDVPSDLRRSGSYTTLYVLETEIGSRHASRWTKIRHATVWLGNFLRSRRRKSLPPFVLDRADASKVGVYSNNLKDMIEESLSSAGTSMRKARDRSDSAGQRTENDKKNYLMRPLTPLSSEIFGQFYGRHYTHHRPIVPWKVSEERSEKVCPHKHLALATFPESDPASTIKELFVGLGIQTSDNRSNTEVISLPPSGPRTGGFQPLTESEMLLVKNLNKTGWKLMSDGTLAKKKVPLNSSKIHSYLPPLLVKEIRIRDGMKSKGERCFSKRHKT